MTDIIEGLWFLTVLLAKVVAIVVVALYYLIRQLVVGIDPPNHDQYKALDPMYGAMPDEPTKAQMESQMNRYEKSEWNKYLRQIEAGSKPETPF